MKGIITAVVAIVFVVIGGVGGHFLKSGSGGEAASTAYDAHAEEGGDSHGDSYGEADDGHGGGHGASDDSHGGDSYGGGGGHGGGYGSGGPAYFKFSREFVVPLMRGERVQSLVILNISLETTSKVSEQLFSIEPKLRDNIMTTLVGLSNDGTTLSLMTNADNYEKVRETVLENLENIVPEGIDNVLILDAAKQDL